MEGGSREGHENASIPVSETHSGHGTYLPGEEEGKGLPLTEAPSFSEKIPQRLSQAPRALGCWWDLGFLLNQFIRTGSDGVTLVAELRRLASLLYVGR